MRWQLFFICALWGVVFVNGRHLHLPDTIPTLTLTVPDPTDTVTTDTHPTSEPIATSEPTITLEPVATSEPVTSLEPLPPLFKTALHRVLRAVTFDDEINEVEVIIPQGRVVGSIADDGNYFQFFGIPYADTTAGANRFKAPLPPPTFENTFIANRNDIKCVRALGVGYEGTEDCLVANIFTPSLDRAGQLPVMVWVKGREFDKDLEHEFLSFKNFIEKDVIVVSLNYRESILGFLCLGTETAPGNAGLKDIIAGLRWVKENIAQFGGNPDDITLFGHGSGAAAVDLVTLSPMANGLVNKAISQSGNAMAPWAMSRDNLKYAVEVAEALGHVVSDVDDLSHILERTSIAALMGVINELDLTENALAFAPCIEKQDLEGVEPFLTKTPSEIIADGEFLQIPFITGFVDNEGTIRAEEAFADDWLERMEESFANFLQSDLKFESDAERDVIAQQIRQFYFEDGPIDVSTLDKYIEYYGETMMLVSTIREVRARAQVSSTPTYLYIFSYKGDLGEPFAGPIEVETAAHSEELAYMFHSARQEEVSDWDLTVAEILIERWTNFAKTGTPSSEISQIIWQPFTSNDYSYLRVLAPSEINAIDATLEVDLTNPHPETMSFWDAIYEEHFLDAESSWALTERNDDDDLIEGSGEEGNDGDGGNEDTGDDGGAADGNEDGGSGNIIDDGQPEDEDNSASTTVGCTFAIIALFSLLNKFHDSQLIL